MKKEKNSKTVNRNGFPQPKYVRCFKKNCKEMVLVKYVIAQKSYSKINNWEYWVNPEVKNPEFWKDKESRKKDRYICNSHLLALYYDKEIYWETITDPLRKTRLRVYIGEGKFSTSA